MSQRPMRCREARGGQLPDGPSLGRVHRAHYRRESRKRANSAEQRASHGYAQQRYGETACDDDWQLHEQRHACTQFGSAKDHSVTSAIRVVVAVALLLYGCQSSGPGVPAIGDLDTDLRFGDGLRDLRKARPRMAYVPYGGWIETLQADSTFASVDYRFSNRTPGAREPRFSWLLQLESVWFFTTPGVDRAAVLRLVAPAAPRLDRVGCIVQGGDWTEVQVLTQLQDSVRVILLAPLRQGRHGLESAQLVIGFAPASSPLADVVRPSISACSITARWWEGTPAQ
jgi:hypothetical protein